MTYSVSFKPKSLKDLKKIPNLDQMNILSKIEDFSNGIKLDVKKLTNFSPEYRLRVNNYRVLFEIEKDTIVVYRVLHRKESYNK